MFKKGFVLAVISLATFIPASAFAAYKLPAPTTVAASTVTTDSVDFTRSSRVEGTFTIDNNSDESVWVTAGRVADGKAGYGFLAHEDQLFLVTNDGYSQLMMPLGFIHTGVPMHVAASFTPHDGVRVDTASIGTAWSQFSRSFQTSGIPGFIRGLGYFNVSITSRSNAATVFIENYTYTD